MDEPQAHPDVDRQARDAIGEDEARADLEAPAADRSADGQDWPFRMARCQRPVLAVGDQVELFEHNLSDQDLAPGRSHDGLDPRGEVPDFDRYVRHRSFFPALVRVDDGSRSKVSEPQLRRDLLRDYEIHRAGVDDPFDRRSSDVGLDAVPAIHDRAVFPVLQRHAGWNLSHRHGSPILTPLDLPVQSSDRPSARPRAWPFDESTALHKLLTL